MQSLFITSKQLKSERWLAAFPEAIVIDESQLSSQHLDTNTLVWLVLIDNWPQHMRLALAASSTIVALTLSENVTQAKQLISAGAMGYVHAFAAPELLQQVQGVVSSGGAWMGAGLLQALVSEMPKAGLSQQSMLSQLTDRQRAVACCVAEGKTNKTIAEELTISERTVKAHISDCFEKLAVENRVQLALLLNK